MIDMTTHYDRLSDRVDHDGDPRYRYDDGGRSAAGYKGTTGDCVVRSITIATELPYQSIYDALNIEAKANPIPWGRGPKKRILHSSARTGVHRKHYDRFLKDLGWLWTPTMTIGSGCHVHLLRDELPSGRLICRVSKHMVAVIDGVIHDTHDCSRGGTRCVYGYYSKPEVS
jgi:hypothetical protein